MESGTCGDALRVGDWCVHRASGELVGPDGTQRVEPKVMDLLWLLAARPGQVVSRETIFAALWPGVIVGDDSLARTVSKLRQALGDDARAPRYVETIAKRGYRLLADVTPAGPVRGDAEAAQVATDACRRGRRRWRVIAIPAAIVALLALAGAAWWQMRPHPAGSAQADSAALLARADDFYFQFSRADNEAAIELYRRVLDLHPDDAGAMAGLANALVQRALRWPQQSGTGTTEFRQLRDALANGHLRREPQRAQLEYARRLAARAVALAPDSAAAHKAVGFVASAQGRFDEALAAYRRAVALDPDAWGPMINIGDVLEINGHDAEALPWFERAYRAMSRRYDRDPAQVRPWQASLGVLIASRLRARGERVAAEGWYRRVLANAPMDVAATSGLAALLRESGDVAQAARLCEELRQRVSATCTEAGD